MGPSRISVRVFVRLSVSHSYMTACNDNTHAKTERGHVCVCPTWRRFRFVFPSGGGEANEAAIRIARRFTGKHKVMSQYRSYHGKSPAPVAPSRGF